VSIDETHGRIVIQLDNGDDVSPGASESGGTVPFRVVARQRILGLQWNVFRAALTVERYDSFSEMVELGAQHQRRKNVCNPSLVDLMSAGQYIDEGYDVDTAGSLQQ
jgi:hypothetical protein